MKFLELADYPLPEGESSLVWWVPTVAPAPSAPAPAAETSWPDDPRATSFVHEQHLRGYALRDARGERSPSWLGIGMEFPGVLSHRRLNHAIVAWIDRHEVLRTHVSIDGAPETGPLRRQTQPPGPVAVTATASVHSPTHSTAVLAEVESGFDASTGPLSWPGYRFATVQRAEGFTVFFASDHSLVDGYSLLLASWELPELYQNPDEPRVLPVTSYVDFSAAERQAAMGASATHPAVIAWREFFAPTPNNPGYITPRFPLPLARPGRRASESIAAGEIRQQRTLNAFVLDDDTANRFTQVCAEAGGSLTAGVLAAMAKINTDLGVGPLFRCIIPRHTRNEPGAVGSVGWYVGVAPFTLDTSHVSTFAGLVRAAMASWKASKIGTTLPFLRVAQILALRDPVAVADGDLVPRFVVSFVDTRSAPNARAADDGAAAVLRSRDYSPTDVYLWVNRTPSGLQVSARFPGTTTAAHTTLMYVGALRSILTSIADGTAYAGFSRAALQGDPALLRQGHFNPAD